ncbi:hypothetical protein ABWJ92_37335 [Streptomyces sp. NPDC000609]|uniref:hypothetical protein n=1 Tax=Streptomyces sp. NPDC000609 TaxID=3160957 RepID=UPI0033996240
MQRFTEDDFGLTWLMNSFHADWTNCAGSEAGALGLALRDELDPRQVMSLRRDAASLMERLPAGTVERLWESGVEFPGFFGPRVPSGTLWMRLIVRECDAWLSRSRTVPLGKADQEEGFDHADAVLGELEEEVDHLGEDLTSALIQCVRRCTPDLAFRILLQALECKGQQIDRSRYERLEGIGTGLRYGKFLVSRLEHLVPR